MGSIQPLVQPTLKNSAGAAPVRAPASIRRTSSIDVWWPDGRKGVFHVFGRARDAITPASGGAPVVIALDTLEAVLTAGVREIVSIQATPPRPALSRLVGETAGKRWRPLLAEAVPQERELATPLFL